MGIFIGIHIYVYVYIYIYTYMYVYIFYVLKMLLKQIIRTSHSKLVIRTHHSNTSLAFRSRRISGSYNKTLRSLGVGASQMIGSNDQYE